MSTPFADPDHFEVWFDLPPGQRRVPLAVLRVLNSYGFDRDGSVFLVKAKPGVTSQSLRAEIVRHLKSGEKVHVHASARTELSGGHYQPVPYEALSRAQKEKRRIQRRHRQVKILRARKLGETKKGAA